MSVIIATPSGATITRNRNTIGSTSQKAKAQPA